MQFIETNNSTQQRVCWLHRREAASHQLVDGRRDRRRGARHAVQLAGRASQHELAAGHCQHLVDLPDVRADQLLDLLKGTQPEVIRAI